MNSLSHIRLLIFLATAALITSCADDPPYADNFTTYDIVQLLSVDNTQGSTFAYYLPDNDIPVVYTAQNAVIDTNRVNIGKRMLLAYIPHDKPYVDGPVTATGYSTIYNSSIKTLTTDSLEKVLHNDLGLYIYSIWRAGPFLNVHARSIYSKKQVSISLLADSAQMARKPDEAKLYLTYTMSQPAENFERDFYASFDISKIWDNQDISAITVMVDNHNLTTDNFKFSK